MKTAQKNYSEKLVCLEPKPHAVKQSHRDCDCAKKKSLIVFFIVYVSGSYHCPEPLSCTMYFFLLKQGFNIVNRPVRSRVLKQEKHS